MHKKFNRSMLHQINIQKICEEIMNPPVPIALRLSATLMTGVVIVYGQQVDLHLGDANDLLAELKAAWKVPKGKLQAKYNSVTLPPNRNKDLVEDEELLPYSNTTQRGGFSMELDNVDVPDLNQYQNQEEDHHQAEAAMITLNDDYLFQPMADTATFDHLERFDVEGDDEEMDLEFIPLLLPKSDEVLERQSKKANLQDQRRIDRRRARSLKSLASMYDHTTSISGKEYKSWVKNVPVDIVRERKPVRSKDVFSLMKKKDVMELPSIVQMERLVTSEGKVHYAKELLELYGDSIPSIFTEPTTDDSQPLDRGVGSSTRSSIEKQRASTVPRYDDMPLGILTGELRSNKVGVSASIAIPSYSGDEIPPRSETNLGRSGKKRPFSATTESGNVPEPVAAAAAAADRITKNKLTQDHETRPAKSQKLTQREKDLVINQPDNQTAEFIRMLKAHLDAHKVASLNQLVSGMTKNRAAFFFYQTCATVHATLGEIRVKQEVPYGDIIIVKGPKICNENSSRYI